MYELDVMVLVTYFGKQDNGSLLWKHLSGVIVYGRVLFHFRDLFCWHETFRVTET